MSNRVYFCITRNDANKWFGNIHEFYINVIVVKQMNSPFQIGHLPQIGTAKNKTSLHNDEVWSHDHSLKRVRTLRNLLVITKGSSMTAIFTEW